MKNNKPWIIILILFVLLLLPNLCALYFSSDLYGQLVKRIAYIALSIGLILLPALFLRAKTYFILLGLLSFIFVPIDIASLYLNHQPASSLFVYTILMTDWHEACELLKSVWPLTIFVVLLYGIYICLVVKLENRYLFGKKVRYGLITIVLGMLIHWIPENAKRHYRFFFAALPLPIMAIFVVLFVFVIYQFITADLQKFIYFQF